MYFFKLGPVTVYINNIIIANKVSKFKKSSSAILNLNNCLIFYFFICNVQ